MLVPSLRRRLVGVETVALSSSIGLRGSLVVAVRDLSASLIRVLAVVLLLCSSAAAESSPSPRGFWNGFLGHMNVVECSNLDNKLVELQLDIFSNDGTLKASPSVTLAPYGTRHIVLDSFGIADQYGTYQLRGAVSAVSCTTVIYRMLSDSSDKKIEYAFEVPMSMPTHGELAGIFNSINVEPSAPPVYNWLSVVNTGSDSFNANLKIFDSSGVLQQEYPGALQNLRPGERRDLALGHDVGKIAGMYKIVPENSNAGYTAFLTRYSPAANSFRYAFVLTAESPRCSPEVLHASTMGNAYNWGELANPTDSPVHVRYEVRDQQGRILADDSELVLAPNSQHHIALHEILGPSNVGSLRVACNGSGAGVIAQSIFYGHKDASFSQLEWSYATQARRSVAVAGQKPLYARVNTFLDAANWLKFLDSSNNTSHVSVQLLGANGVSGSSGDLWVAPSGTSDIAVHEWAGKDVIGTIRAVVGSDTASNSSELLRVYPRKRGGIGYIVNLRSLGGSATTDQKPVNCDAGDDVQPGTLNPLCDGDADGIADVWERQYGLNPANRNDASLDKDGDRLSNLEEFRRGLVPTVYDSEFSGSETSLAPYYGTITDHEAAHLLRTWAFNDRKLLNGTTTFSLNAVIAAIFDQPMFAEDLQRELKKFQSASTNMADPEQPQLPILPLSNPLQTPEQISAGFEAIAQLASTGYNPMVGGPSRDSWTLSSYLIANARYESPLPALMAHFWAGHFGTSVEDFDGPRAHWQMQFLQTLLMKKGLGSFRDLIVGDPSLQGCTGYGDFASNHRDSNSYICNFANTLFLNNEQNRAGNPNENFAREFHELGVVGPVDYWNPARPVTYTEETVKAATRYFSGYQYIGGLFPYYVYYRPENHDVTSQTVFRGTPYQFTGTMTPGQYAAYVVDNNPQVPRYIAGKLFSMLVYPDPPKEVVDEAARIFKDELHYNIKELLRRYARSQAMFSARARAKNCVLEPFKAFTRWSRGLEIPMIAPTHETFDRWANARDGSRILFGKTSGLLAAGGEDLLINTRKGVFSFDYCGRYPGDGVDGSGEWLEASRMLERHKAAINYMWNLRALYIDGRPFDDIRKRVQGVRATVTPEEIVAYYADVLDVVLTQAERDTLVKYLITPVRGGVPNRANWKITDTDFINAKLAGLSVIFLSLPQANMG